MREIKFRAWDKRNNRMINSEDILNVDFRFREIEYMFRTETFAITFEEADIMQYTGLKDKNGTEIYQGDILIDNYYGKLGKVDCTFEIDYDGLIQELSESNQDCKIIGNIYEGE